MFIISRQVGVGLLFCAALASGCSSDTKSAVDGGSAGRSGSGGAAAGGRSGSAAAGRGGGARAGNASGNALPAPVPCGSGMCAVPAGAEMAMMFGLTPPAPCCIAPATVSCGSQVGGQCVAPVPTDPTCSMMIMGFSLMGCCTPEGMCGIDATAFGMPGCIDISMFGGAAAGVAAARPCGSDSDAGTAEDAGT